ncbi:flagellar protein FlaG [uncultured Thermanaerothrix sp.]|uniref:flagellar protein FlaG n=1 Tax=uncultured Thermanaerothrix sp. TaxID=1195149 RepID=UPI00262F66DE|nr:flagellar protein FlaG [uncultured Thermanaerothrix sp.]
MQGEAKLQGVGPATSEIGGRISVEREVNLQKVPVAETQDEKRQYAPVSDPGATSSVRGGAEIALRFQVDPQTRRVTVFVLDKTHRHVIRTIPPEEMARLRAGEIVDLFV